MMGLLALVAVATLMGCAERLASSPSIAASPLTVCCFSPEVLPLEPVPPGPCSLAGTAYTEDAGGLRPAEGIVIHIYYIDGQGACSERPIATTVTDRRGRYLFSNLPTAELPSQVRIIAAYRPGCFCLERRLGLYPFQRAVCDLVVGESWAGFAIVMGDAPNIDPMKAGSGSIVSADPRTGEPTYHPY